MKDLGKINDNFQFYQGYEGEPEVELIMCVSKGDSADVKNMIIVGEIILLYLNDREQAVIGRFMTIANDMEETRMLLRWRDGSWILGIYDSIMEDENDFELEDERYEEFWSFIFRALDLSGDPPVYITEDEYFCISYHNFPEEMLVDGKDIL